jgi:hypothetical protein
VKRKRKPDPNVNNNGEGKLGETSNFSLEIKLAGIDELTKKPGYTFHIFQTLVHATTGTEIKVEVGRSTIPGERDKVIQAGLNEIQVYVQDLKNASIRQKESQVQVHPGS